MHLCRPDSFVGLLFGIRIHYKKCMLVLFVSEIERMGGCAFVSAGSIYGLGTICKHGGGFREVR